MAADPPLGEVYQTFAALGDPTRLALLLKLSAGTPLSITRLSRDARISRQAVTKHLHVLQAAGLVRGVARGRENLFKLEPARLEEARRTLELVSRQWDD